MIDVQGGSNMTGTDFCVNKPHISPVIFEPPRTIRSRDISQYILCSHNAIEYQFWKQWNFNCAPLW